MFWWLNEENSNHKLAESFAEIQEQMKQNKLLAAEDNLKEQKESGVQLLRQKPQRKP